MLLAIGRESRFFTPMCGKLFVFSSRAQIMSTSARRQEMVVHWQVTRRLVNSAQSNDHTNDSPKRISKS